MANEHFVSILLSAVPGPAWNVSGHELFLCPFRSSVSLIIDGILHKDFLVVIINCPTLVLSYYSFRHLLFLNTEQIPPLQAVPEYVCYVYTMYGGDACFTYIL